MECSPDDLRDEIVAYGNRLTALETKVDIIVPMVTSIHQRLEDVAEAKGKCDGRWDVSSILVGCILTAALAFIAASL